MQKSSLSHPIGQYVLINLNSNAKERRGSRSVRGKMIVAKAIDMGLKRINRNLSFCVQNPNSIIQSFHWSRGLFLYAMHSPYFVILIPFQIISAAFLNVKISDNTIFIRHALVR